MQEILLSLKLKQNSMSNHTLIIAEAGVNHNGSLDIAKQLIDAAVDAGVDIIKFQTFKADKLVSKDAKKAEYQKKNIGDGDDSQYQMLKKLELSDADHQELVAYCHQKGIRFWSTAFDLESIDFLHSLGLGLWKIPSGEITNYPFIKKIALLHEPVIMSTGMCDEEDIRNAMEVLLKNGLTKEQITILHCNTQYPTPMKDVNLKAMLTIKQDFGTIVGYSDHTQGIEVPIAAVALGASASPSQGCTACRCPWGCCGAIAGKPQWLCRIVAVQNRHCRGCGNSRQVVSCLVCCLIVARLSDTQPAPRDTCPA